MRLTRLVQALVALPLVLFALTACGDDDSTEPTSGDGGSETTESGGGGDGESVNVEDVDLCTLVSDETLAAANLSAADGVAKEWVGSPACVYGEDLDRRLIIVADYTGAGDLTIFYDELTEISGHEAAVEFDSEMTCQLIFDVGEARLQVLVEDLGRTELTPGEPCDTGYPAAKDVLEALGG